MPVHHSAAPEVRRIAENLIPKYHKHLVGIRMEYLFQSQASRGGGKITLGKARKITGFNALLSTPDLLDDPDATSEGCEYFLITIAADMWELLGDKARVALIDHELSHCKVDRTEDNDVILSMYPHEIEEFADVLHRHGLWRPDLTNFMRNVGSDMLSLWSDLPPNDEEFYVQRDGHDNFAEEAALARAASGVNPDGEVQTTADGEPLFT